ncbi:FAD/NAD(P)-binding protein [Nesterenkonia sp.]|uniref:FAD/NAD(P)-binding protein n=1 Tax=Nesterenkonia sp. TaxID=704201 RepID=UPI0026371926|nr:FAD/NAD(P)-binding protein [Nesterenkonia sp.]
MGSSAEYVIAVIGAGPRGTSLLERLLAHIESTPAAQRPKLRVTVYDPAPHGPGRVWDPSQSPLYLMNTPASYPTAAPTGATLTSLSESSCAASFSDYSQLKGLGYEDATYPTRAHYGEYLAWLSKEVSARLRGRGAAVDHVRSEVTVVQPDDGGYQLRTPRGWRRADAVVLALGHIPAAPGGPSGHLARTAQELGLHYQGPEIPTEVDLSAFPAGAPVLIRGMGLNFFDLMIQLTVGRGGRFRHRPGADPGHRLEYIPSGQEPVLVAGSRRGTPYRAKTTAPGFVPEGIELHHLTEQRIADLLAAHRQLDFTEHLWPLIRADVQDTYARVSGQPGSPFDVQAYARPFDHRDFSSHTAYQQAMLDWLAEDAASAEAGAQNPEKMAVNALHAARLRIKPLVTEGRISPESRLRDVEGWFESLVEGLASGPPLQRIEELAALVRASVVEFLGPAPAYGVDRQTRRFIADSPLVAGVRYSAEHMVEAMMPPNRITQAAAPVVRSLLEAGTARPAVVHYGSEAHVHKGFDVTPQPHQLVTAEGEVLHGAYVLGLQLSSVQWGTAIAAEAGGDTESTARTLADADAAAADLLRRARAALDER